MKNIAHRGASGYFPENTNISFLKAIEMGATGIETDVHLTKDGELVLIHDEKVDRTTNGTGFVKDLTYKEIRELDAGSWYDEKFKNEKIPHLEELLEIIAKEDIILNIELKNNIVQYKNIEEKVINLIYKYKVEKKIIISSFNHYAIRKCIEIDKNIDTGLLYVSGIYKPYKYAAIVGANYIHPYFYAIMDKDLIKETKNKGIGINAYGVNNQEHMKLLVQYGVSGIITDYPDLLEDILNKKS